MNIDMIDKRKKDHLDICLNQDVEFKTKKTGFEDVMLINRSLPEIDIEEIKLSTDLFNKHLSYPFIVASITGGYKDSIIINKNIAQTVEELNIGMGVGSQRISLNDKNLIESFSVVRDYAPTALIYANIGISQIYNYNIESIEKLIDMIEANAIAIHLNLLQELIQPEGNPKSKNWFYKIKELVESIKIPVFVKETGCGISKEDVRLLEKTGILAIDVGGAGGTSWSGIESYRAKNRKNYSKKRLGELFWDFGIPTASSLIECQSSLPLIATGGIRSGLDIAKSIALGATIASSALPFVSLAMNGKSDVTNYILQLIKELKISMFLTGNSSLESLSKTPLVITGFTKEYIIQRKLTIKNQQNLRY